MCPARAGLKRQDSGQSRQGLSPTVTCYRPAPTAATTPVNSHRNTITVDLSAGASGGFTTRTLTTTIGTTAYPVNYNLYLDAADTVIWGDGTGGSQADTVTLTRHGNNNTITTNLTVYGAVAPAQDPAPGIYTDSITVTVNF
jgi:spore coat protein U-like protein